MFELADLKSKTVDELKHIAADLQVTGSGVMWPPASDPAMADLTAASRHFPVWVDITLP